MYIHTHTAHYNLSDFLHAFWFKKCLTQFPQSLILSLSFHINNRENYTLMKSLSFSCIKLKGIKFSNKFQTFESAHCVRAHNSILPNDLKGYIIKHLLRGICL